MKEKFDAILLFLIVVMMVTAGCGEETPIEPSLVEEPATLGELKVPEDAVAAAPALPNAGLPFVKEMSYYKDWKLTKEVVDTVAPGTTLFVKVVFSEAMQHIVADDKSARPVLYHKTDKKLTRLHVAKHGAKLQDGDAKPKGKGTITFIGKVTMPDSGVFTVAVGKLSADLDGNTLAAFYTHKEKLQVEEPDTVPPTVTEVTYWQDEELSLPIDIFHGGDIYTKIVFSEEMKVVIADEKKSRPILFYQIGRERLRYRVTDTDTLQDGDAATQDGITFVCKNTIPEPERVTPFFIIVGKVSTDQRSNKLTGNYIHPTRVIIEPVPVVEPEPEPVPEPTEPDVPAVDLDDPIHLERAIAVARRIYDRDQEIAALFYADSITLDEYWHRLDQILIEETGLQYYDWHFVGDLTAIYEQERPQEAGRLVSGKFSRRGMNVEWMRLYFAYPETTKEERIELFRQSVKNGKVSIEYNQFW